MKNLTLKLVSTMALAVTSALPVSAHAGFAGDTVEAIFSGGGGFLGPPLNFGFATVGAGVEFTGTATTVSDQVWTFSIDVFDTGVTLSWTEVESTLAGLHRGHMLSPDAFVFDLGFVSSVIPPLALSTFSSEGVFSPGVSSLTSIAFPAANIVHVGFSRLDSSDSYTLSAQSISAVPEPETYAMMLAGLGLLGFAARRRKQQAAA